VNTSDKLSLLLPLDASTTYVEHLRNKPSALSTPVSSTLPSPKLPSRVDVDTRSRHPSVEPICLSETTPLLLAQIDPSVTTLRASFPTSVTGSSASLKPNKIFTTNDITTPATTVPHSRSRTRSQSKPIPDDIHSHHLHLTHHVAHPRHLPVVDFIEVLTNSPRICRLGLAGENQHHHHQHDHEYHGEDDGVSHGRLSRRHSFIRLGGDEEHDPHHLDGAVSPGIGRKRQIVSILVSPPFFPCNFTNVVFRCRSSN